ncbi:MAG: glycosyltransferase [Acidobacteria bacterium]|jgi:glycosyltransferase involved in cell wall biosynthesis|nr:glycosyltransferase [Acidobacteriota bacterium]
MNLIDYDDIVSIIMVTWGRLNYTKLSIESLLKNTGHKNFELIIVDNNSQDGTVEYLTQLRKQVDFFTLILNNINLGKAGAMNRGFRIASGQYFLITDNDIIYRKNWLKILLNVYKANPDVGAIGTTNPCAQAKEQRFQEINDFTLEKQNIESVGQSIFLSREVLEKIGNGYIIPPHLCKGTDGLFSRQILQTGLLLAKFKHYLNYDIDQPSHPKCQRYSSLWEETKQCWEIGKGIKDVEKKYKLEMDMFEKKRWYDKISDL